MLTHHIHHGESKLAAARDVERPVVAGCGRERARFFTGQVKYFMVARTLVNLYHICMPSCSSMLKLVYTIYNHIMQFCA